MLAFTQSGKGPWSVEFRGTTLDNARNSSIIWSGSEGLVRTDPVMDKVETLIHKSRMRNIAFDDMTWYKDQIYLVSCLEIVQCTRKWFELCFLGDQQQSSILVKFNVAQTGSTNRC